jgi:hypothetical protein
MQILSAIQSTGTTVNMNGDNTELSTSRECKDNICFKLSALALFRLTSSMTLCILPNADSSVRRSLTSSDVFC